MMYEVLKKNIEKRKKTFITLDEIYNIIKNTNINLYKTILTPSGYLSFYNSINELIESEILKPTGKKTNNKRHPLHLKYRKVKKVEDFKKIKLEIAMIPFISTKYYLNHPKEYLEDKKYIDTIIEFLKETEKEEVSLNERSYQLFNDEKFLKHPGSKKTAKGEQILKNLGLTSEDLHCYPSYEPFIHFISPSFMTKDKRTILIIENLDTFWSFKRLIYNDKDNPLFDMLIFGKGNSITGNFKYIEEYSVTLKDQIYYFGDIDAAGVNIYVSLIERFKDYNITLFTTAYEHLIDSVVDEFITTSKKKQRINKSNIEKFLSYFDSEYKSKMSRILTKGYYIPQEAISLRKLKDIFIKENK